MCSGRWLHAGELHSQKGGRCGEEYVLGVRAAIRSARFERCTTLPVRLTVWVALAVPRCTVPKMATSRAATPTIKNQFSPSWQSTLAVRLWGCRRRWWSDLVCVRVCVCACKGGGCQGGRCPSRRQPLPRVEATIPRSGPATPRVFHQPVPVLGPHTQR